MGVIWDVIIFNFFDMKTRGQLIVDWTRKRITWTNQTQFPFSWVQRLIKSSCFGHKCVASLQRNRSFYRAEVRNIAGSSLCKVNICFTLFLVKRWGETLWKTLFSSSPVSLLTTRKTPVCSPRYTFGTHKTSRSTKNTSLQEQKSYYTSKISLIKIFELNLTVSLPECNKPRPCRLFSVGSLVISVSYFIPLIFVKRKFRGQSRIMT